MLARKVEDASSGSARTASKARPSSLNVGTSDDVSERQADRVAGEMSASSKASPEWSLSKVSIEAPLQPRAAQSGAPAIAPPIVHEVLNASGQPLEAATRTFFEHRFGCDLTDVRVHADSRAAESADAVQALAYTVGRNVILGSGYGLGTEARRGLLAHELVHSLQQERSGITAVQRQPKPAPEMKLVDDFAAKFPAAASLIKPNPAAMKLVKEAFDAGATFGGYAEDGPSKDVWPYTVGNAVYVPKARADPPVLAMSDFLFELNNAIRQPRFAAITAAATKGAKTDTAAAKQYAHDKVEAEVEGMLRLGEVWFETKAKYLGKQAHAFDKYDKDFFLAEYQSFKDKKKTKDDIINDILQREYETGTLKGKTVEQNYMDQYQRLAH